jgi:hypothetical protein
MELPTIPEAISYEATPRDSIVVKALCYKPEGHGFDTR